MKTIFEKIIDGEIQCNRVYENEHVLAFLDVAPLSVGHTLVIPKESVSSLHELTPECGAALGEALVTVSKAIVKATGVSEYNILQNNGKLAHQAVFHVHFHIIPKPSDQSGLSIVWNATELDDGEAVADAIRKAL
jgi:histidine triad (HIT) family protein